MDVICVSPLTGNRNIAELILKTFEQKYNLNYASDDFFEFIDENYRANFRDVFSSIRISKIK